MLQILQYYKRIFFLLMPFSLAGEETKTALDAFDESSDKGSFLKDNAEELFGYLKSLDSSYDDKITFNETNSEESNKMYNLFREIGLTGNLSEGISLSELKNKLEEYIKAKQDIVDETKSNISEFREAINIDALNRRTLQKGDKGPDVMVLQEFLIREGYLESKYNNEKSNADGIFGGRTEAALKEYQKVVYKLEEKGLQDSKYVDGILTKNGKTVKTIIENEDMIGSSRYVSERQANISEVNESINKSNINIDSLIKVLRNSKEFYKSLEGREDGGDREDILSDMGSLYGWVSEIVGENEASNYFDKMEGFAEKLEKSEMQDRFNEGYEYILGNIQDENYSSREKSLGLYMGRDMLILLFAGIPMLDVRLNFMKDLANSGVDMDRAYIFSEWVKSGMEQSFEEFEKGEGKDIEVGKDTLISLQALKGRITSYISSNYDIKEEQVNSELITLLSETDSKIKDLIKAYIESRFIPDSETLLLGGFNWLERIAFDEKASDIENLLEALQGNRYMLDIKAKREEYVWDDITIEGTQDVYLLKNNGKYYLEIDGEFKEFNTTPAKEEIKSSVDSYSEGEEEAAKDGWEKIDLKDSQSEQMPLSSTERLGISSEVISLFQEQNEEGWGPFNEGELTGALSNVEARQKFFTEIAEKGTFLKATIMILEARDKNLADTFGKLKFFNSIDDFVNAFAMPESVKEKITKLKDVETNVEAFVERLMELTKDTEVMDFFKALESSEALTKYRLATMPMNEAEHLVDAKEFKYGARMLTPEEFVYTDEELKEIYGKTFKEIYGFNKPESYKEYLNILLTQTGPDKGADKGITVNSLHERGMIEAGILDVSGDDLLEAMTSDRMEALPIEQFDSKTVINTARQIGYTHDSFDTFINLQEERGDTHVFHTTVEKSYSFTTKDGNNTLQTVTYDVYLRPECENLLIVPNSKSVEQIINNTALNTEVSRLNTPTLPIWILGDGLLASKSSGSDRGLSSTPGEDVVGTGTDGGAITTPGQSGGGVTSGGFQP